MNVALYARFSSEKQDADLSIGAQLKALKEYAINHDFEFSENHTFIDEAKSALSDNRPEFKRMIATAKKKPKPFDIILVWKLSRFARNRKDSIVYKSLLKSLGIEVISINEPFDDSPAGQLLEGIIEVIDEFYSANLGQDTLRGMTENAKRGFFNGGRAPIGLKRIKVKDGSTERTKLDLDPEYSPIVKRMFLMAADGMSLKSIAQTLNQEGILTPSKKRWNKQTISNLITNRLFTGALVWNKSGSKPNSDPTIIENTHPALIDKATFNQVQQLIDEKRVARNPRSSTSPYLLSGLLKCGICNGSLTGYSVKSKQKTYYYYACCRTLNQGKGSCDLKNIPRDKLEEWVIEHLREGLLNDDLLAQFVEHTNQKIIEDEESISQEVDSISTQINTTKRRLDRLYDALESGSMEAEDLAPRIKELRTSLEQLQQKKLILVDQQDDSNGETVGKEAVRTYINNINHVLPTLKPAYRKRLFKLTRSQKLDQLF